MDAAAGTVRLRAAMDHTCSSRRCGEGKVEVAWRWLCDEWGKATSQRGR